MGNIQLTLLTGYQKKWAIIEPFRFENAEIETCTWVGLTSTQVNGREKNVIACVIEFWNEENRNRTSKAFLNFESFQVYARACVCVQRKVVCMHLELVCWFGELVGIFWALPFLMLIWNGRFFSSSSLENLPHLLSSIHFHGPAKWGKSSCVSRNFQNIHEKWRMLFAPGCRIHPRFWS